MDLALDPAVAHTAIKTRKCHEIAERYYNTPKPLISEIVVGVPKSFAQEKKKVVPAPGFLRRVSPPEPLHALIMAIHKDVKEENVDKLQQWRGILLNTLLSFETVEADASLHFKNTQLREKSGIEHELIRHSSLSRCLDIVNFSSRTHAAAKSKKPDKGKASWAKQVSEAYNADLVMSELSEKVTETWVDRALAVNSRMLTKSAAIVEKLLYLDDAYGVKGPLDSIHKLHAMLAKAGTGPSSVKKLEWMVLMIADLFENGALDGDQTSKRELTNRLCDVLIAKHDVRSELLKWGEATGVQTQALQKLQEVSENLEKYRKTCGYSWLPAKQQPSCGWRAAFTPSADLFMTLLDGLVFGTTFDEVIATWVRSKKALADLLKMSPLSESLEEVAEKIEDRVSWHQGCKSFEHMLSASPQNPSHTKHMCCRNGLFCGVL